MKEFDLEDPGTRRQFIDNLKKELPLSLESFDFNNLWKTDRGERLLDTRDAEAVANAMQSIFDLFCPPARVYPDINNAMGEDEENENPAYCRDLWRLAMLARLVVGYTETPVQNDSGKEGHERKTDEANDSKRTPTAKQPYIGSLTASKQSAFAEVFKPIKFSSMRELKDKEFDSHLKHMTQFIDEVLSKMEGKKARKVVNNFGTAVFQYRPLDNSRQVPEDDLNELFNSHYAKPVQNFFNELILEDIVFKKFSTPRKKVLELCDEFSYRDQKIKCANPNKTLKAGFTEDTSLRIKRKRDRKRDSKRDGFEVSGLGVELKTFALGIILEKILKPKTPRIKSMDELSEVMRQVTYYMICDKTNFFFLSDYRFCLYFEYPLDDGVQWTANGDVAAVMGNRSPLRFKIIDAMSRSGRLTTQVLLSVKLFENACAAGCKSVHGDDMPSFVDFKDRATTGLNGQMTPEFKTFVGKLLEAALKGGKSDSDNKGSQPGDNKRDGADDDANDDFDNKRYKKRHPGNEGSGNKSNKRSKTATVSGKSSEGTKNMKRSFSSIPESFLSFHLKKFKLLAAATTRYSVKFVIPLSELYGKLESISTPTQLKKRVFFKVFDDTHIATLIYEIFHGDTNPEWALQSDRILFRDFVNDFDAGHQDFADNIAKDSKAMFQNELKAYKRIMEYNQSTTDPQHMINCPQLLQYGYTTMKIDEDHYFEGPYLVFQYLPFVEKKPETDTEKENLKQQILNLERAGISHNDLEKRNFCCDHDGKVYIFDYGNSSLEGEEQEVRW